MPSAEAGADSTEWEYEYDDNDTEDVYFTLDLSSCRPRHSLSKSNTTGSKSSNTTTTTSSDIQILDLHAENPLVRFDNTLCSCHWSSTLGTQFYLAPSGTVQPVLRNGHVVDVIGLSRAKLVGTPATLRERKEPAAAHTVGASVDHAISLDDAESPSEYGDASDDAVQPANDVPSHDDGTGSAQQRFSALRQNTSDPTVKARASFLERLSAIKQNRGDTDSIPFYGVKNYRILSEEDKDEIRQTSLAVDGGQPAVAAPLTGRSKKRGPYRKRPSGATTETIDATSAKRKKSGPKSASEIRGALGLKGTTNVPATLQRIAPRPPAQDLQEEGSASASTPTTSASSPSDATEPALSVAPLPPIPKEGDAAHSELNPRPG